MRQFHLIVTSVTLLFAVATASAAEMEVPPPSKPEPLSVYVNQPNCSRWTDECVNCTRGADGTAPVCSNIGVSCQPKPVRCLATENQGETQKPEEPRTRQ